MSRRRRYRAVLLLATAAAVVGYYLVQSTGGAAPAAPVDGSAAGGQLTALHIAPAGPMTGYSRDQFGHGWGQQPDGCDTRVDALRAQGQDVTTSGRCTVTGGRWVSLYDGQTVTDPHALDGDHLVPLANAWISGAAAWTGEQRTRFANDPAEVVMVTAHSNRSKGDQAPPGYEPVAGERCSYAQHWITIKATYRLSITSREHDALADMLTTCGKDT